MPVLGKDTHANIYNSNYLKYNSQYENNLYVDY
jgi:hypothetical protein